MHNHKENKINKDKNIDNDDERNILNEITNQKENVNITNEGREKYIMTKRTKSTKSRTN